MGADTKIEWADDTANFWEGCTQISPACAFCYAKTRAERYGTVEWNGPPRKVHAGGINLRASNRRGQAEGRVRLVFINSLSDAFDKLAKPEWRREMFDEIKCAPWVHALILTKRIGNAVEMSEAAGGFPKNASLGASIVTVDEMKRDMHKLVHAKLALGRPSIFLSIEPLLEGVLIPPTWLNDLGGVIVGGESGPDARPLHPWWARALRDQCEAAGVPFHFKQWGEWIEGRDRSGACGFQFIDGRVPMKRVGKANAGRLLDGRTHDAFLPIDRAQPIYFEAAL